ncbi:unnamed protein product, partial [Didymodactylos carnosus]
SDRIKENLFNASNVVVTCRASGKLTTSLVSTVPKHATTMILQKCFSIILNILSFIRNVKKSKNVNISLVSYWVDKVLRPSLSGTTLLIPDCWNGQGDNKGFYDGIKGLFRVETPAKTTSYRQPLDIYFNRQPKVLPVESMTGSSSTKLIFTWGKETI